MIKNLSGKLLLSFIALGLSCCARIFPPPRIALLPFDNETNDINAPNQVRVCLYEEMNKKNYNLVNLDGIDSFLGGKGIVEGGSFRLFHLTNCRKESSRIIIFLGCWKIMGLRASLSGRGQKYGCPPSLKSGCSQEIVFEGREGASVNHIGVEAA